MTVTRIMIVALAGFSLGCQSARLSETPYASGPGELATQVAKGDAALDHLQEVHTSPALVAESAEIQPPGPEAKQVCHLQPLESEGEANGLEPIPQLLEQPNGELTLEVLEGIALQNNPALAEALSRVEAAQGNWVQAGLPPNPVVGYSGQQLGSDGAAEQQGVFLGQEFVTGKKLKLNREVASWRVDRAQRELEAQQLRVLTDVRIRHYNVLIAQRRRELAKELVRISDQGVAAANTLLENQEVSEADPLRARIEADSSRIVLQTSINQHIEAWRQLVAVLGTPDLPLQQVAGELEADAPDLSWDATLQQIVCESPEIAAAASEAQAATWAIERAYAEVIPDIDVQAVIQDDRGTGSTNANLQLSLPIPIFDRNQGGIRRAHAEAAAAEQAVSRLTLELQVRLAAAFQRYETAQNQVDMYARAGGILDKTDRSLELVRLGYEGSEVGVLDLLSVQRTYFETNLAYLDSLREQWIAAMEIRGLLLQGSLRGDR